MIKSIFNYVKDYATNHLMINSFNYGDNFNIIKTGEDQYPQMFLEYPFTINYIQKYKDITFAVYFIELPNESGTDDIDLLEKVEHLNDIFLMKMDLLDHEEFSSLVSSNSLTLTEAFGDKVVAIRTEITLRVLRDLNACQEPI